MLDTSENAGCEECIHSTQLHENSYCNLFDELILMGDNCPLIKTKK